MKKRKKIIVKKIIRRVIKKKPANTPKDVLTLEELINSGKKISIITACMNRYDNLKLALSTWIECPEIYEIIILDYGSKIPLSDFSIHKLSDKIKLYRTNTDYWHLTRAYNIAAQYATGDIILKMDADYCIKPGFFKHHKLSDNSFIYGGRGVGFLFGFLALYRDSFMLINGYNERIINYGYDDQDIFHRCKSVGSMKPIKLNKNFLYHIPHSHYDRIANQKTKQNKIISGKKNYRTATLNPWTKNDTMTPKDVAFRII